MGPGDGVRQTTFVATALLLSTAAWTVVLGASQHPEIAVILMAVPLWVASVVSVTGMLLARARWARRLGLAVTAAQAAAGVLSGPGVWWGIALVLSASTAVALGGPWLDGIIRGRPSAAGPPTRAVLLPLVLIGVPFFLGIAQGEGALEIVVGVAALASAFWFIRALPGALAVVRVLWPGLALAVAVPLGWPTGAVSAAAAIAVLGLAWHPTVRNAVHPLIESGSRVPIPPELAPREILDAADIDDTGRPR